MVEEKGKKEHRCHQSSELKFLLGEPHIQLTYHFNLLDHENGARTELMAKETHISLGSAPHCSHIKTNNLNSFITAGAEESS